MKSLFRVAIPNRLKSRKGVSYFIEKVPKDKGLGNLLFALKLLRIKTGVLKC